MILRHLLALLFLGLFVPAVVAAEQHAFARGGDARVDGTLIQAYKAKWKITGRGKDGTVKDGGTWSDSVQLVKLHDRDVLRRAQVWNYGSGTETFVNYVDRKTLLPIITEFTNTSGIYYRFEYSADARTVRYQRSPPLKDDSAPYNIADPMEQGTVHLDVPVWDFNGGMFGLLIAAFPLEAGYAAKIPVFPLVEPNAHPAWVDFTVADKTTVAAGPGKTLEAWNVVANSPATKEVMRFALAKEPPYVIELRQEWQGLDWTFELM